MTLTVKHPFVSTVADDPAAVAAGEVVPSNWNAAHTITLTSGQIPVGNGSNIAAGVALSGDATLDNTGALTLASVITAGGPIGSTTTTPVITFDAKGRLITVTSSPFWNTPLVAVLVGGVSATVAVVLLADT